MVDTQTDQVTNIKATPWYMDAMFLSVSLLISIISLIGLLSALIDDGWLDILS